MSNQINRLNLSPPSSGHLVGLVLVLTFVSLLSAGVLTYSKREYVQGYLQAVDGETRLVATSRGVVTQIASTGTVVQKGQAVATLETNEVLAGGASMLANQMRTLSAKKKSAQIEIKDVVTALLRRSMALDVQRKRLLAAAEEAQTEVAIRREAVALEEIKFARQKDLIGKGFIAVTVLDQVQIDMFLRRAEVLAAARSLAQAMAQVAANEAEYAENEVRRIAQVGLLQRELSTVDQSLAEAGKQSSVTLIATTDGIVTARATALGDSAEVGQLLLKLGPINSPVEAVLLLSGSTLGRVKVGQPVSLQMKAYPYQTLGLVNAEIIHVDASALISDEVTEFKQHGVPPGILVTKVVAKLLTVPLAMGGLTAMRHGDQFTAAIEVDRKSFLAWMMWPLLKIFQ